MLSSNFKFGNQDLPFENSECEQFITCGGFQDPFFESGNTFNFMQVQGIDRKNIGKIELRFENALDTLRSYETLLQVRDYTGGLISFVDFHGEDPTSLTQLQRALNSEGDIYPLHYFSLFIQGIDDYPENFKTIITIDNVDLIFEKDEIAFNFINDPGSKIYYLMD